MKVKDFTEMSIRARTALTRAGIETIEEARAMSDEALLALEGFGQGSLVKIRRYDDLPHPGSGPLSLEGEEILNIRPFNSAYTPPSRRETTALEILLHFTDKAGYSGSSPDLADRAWAIACRFEDLVNGVVED